MNIKVTYQKDSYDKDSDRGLEIAINGKTEFRIGNGEPEDMTMNRDLSDSYNIVDMLSTAHEAGKNGEEFNVEYEDEE